MRRRVKTQWLVTVFVTLAISGIFLYRKNQIYDVDSARTNNNYFKKLSSTTAAAYFSQNSKYLRKHVTKSLTELGRMDEVNRHFLFLNSVPKCGSEILILLLQKLQGTNNFRHVRLKGGNKRKLTKIQQENLVYETYGVIRNEAVPLSFDRHVYFINFTSFDKQSPTYINLIRNPVDKVLSRIPLKSNNGKNQYFHDCLVRKTNNCNFKNGQSYDLTIPYFCGHDARCMILNNEWAIKTAKYNVEKYYPVVGVLEELNVTLEVLEHKTPYFFKGAQRLYYKELLDNYKKKKKFKVSSQIERKLKEALIKEYEFYEWIKSRLFKQLQVMYGEHHNH